MFLALQHSTYAAILDLIQYDCRHNYNLVARAMFLEAAVLLLSLFISEISPSNTRGKLRLVYCHCSCILWNKIRIFEEEILAYCAVVFQSSGCLPPFAAVVAKRYKTMLWWGELHLNMSTYPQRKKFSILKKAPILEFVHLLLW